MDDIDITGPDEEVDAILKRLGEVVLLKVAPIAEPGMIYFFLGRRKMRTKDTLYTAPSRSLLDSVIETSGLENCRKIKSPTEKLVTIDGDNDLLDKTASEINRTCVGKLLFASKDRVDLDYASKELARDLKEPRKRSWRRLKRAGRYLAGTSDLYQEMLNKPNQDLTMDIFVDSDWGGVVDIGDDQRKSTSGCLIFLAGMLFSRTQKERALSSCEAEFLAIALGKQEALFIQRIAEFVFNTTVEMMVWSDSSSARQLCKKRGPGRVRHLDLRTLFVQDLVENKQLRVGPISGDCNPSDVLTKILGETGCRERMFHCLVLWWMNRYNGMVFLLGALRL